MNFTKCTLVQTLSQERPMPSGDKLANQRSCVTIYIPGCISCDACHLRHLTKAFRLLGSRSCKVVKSFKIPNSFTPSMGQFTIIRKHTEAFTRLRGFRLHGKLFIQLKSPFRSLLSRRRFHNGRK